MNESETTTALPSLLWLVLGLSLAGAAFILRRWWNQPDRVRRRQAGQLFKTLCRAHNLEWRAERLLKSLANNFQLEHPAIIFVRPDLFQLERLPEHLRSRRTLVDDLRARLFVRSEEA